MNKTILTADWHIGCGPHHDEDLERAVKTMAESRPRRVIVAGDLFHRNNPSAEEIEFTLELLSRFCNYSDGAERWDAVVHVIAGNHDHAITSALSSDMLDVNFWSDYIAYPYENGLRSNLIMAPHGKLEEIVGGYDDGSFLVMHGYPPGHRPDYVDEESDYDVLDFPPVGVSLVIAGHCHGSRHYMFGACRVLIPGAPTSVTFAEEGQRKGWFVCDNGEFEFIAFDARVMTTIIQGVNALPPNLIAGVYPGRGAAKLILPVSLRSYKRAYSRALREAGHDLVKIEFTREQTRPQVRLHSGADHVGAWIKTNVPAELRADVMDLIKTEVREASGRGERARYKNLHVMNYRALGDLRIDLPESGCLGITGAAGGNPRRSNGRGKSSVLIALADMFCGGVAKHDASGDLLIAAETDTGSVELARSNGEQIRYENAGQHVWKTFYEYNLIGTRSMLDEQPARRLELLLEDLPEREPLRKINVKLKKQLREKEALFLELSGRHEQLTMNCTADRACEELETAERDLQTESQRGLIVAAHVADLEKGIRAREILDRLEKIRADHPDLQFSDRRLARTRGRLTTHRQNTSRYEEQIESITREIEQTLAERGAFEWESSCPLSGRITCPLAESSERAIIISELVTRESGLVKAWNVIRRRLDLSRARAEACSGRIAKLERDEELKRELDDLTEREEHALEVAAVDLQRARDDLRELSLLGEEISRGRRKLTELVGGRKERLRRAVEDADERERVGKEVIELEREIRVLEAARDCTADTGAINLALATHVERINELMRHVSADFDWWQQPAFELRLLDGKPELWGRFADEFRPWRTFSQGEKSAANLTFQLARREIAEEMDGIFPLLMVDECLDALDAENYERAVDYLKRCGYQVLLVSHNPILRDLVDCVVVGG